ncbi:DegV family protein [Vagococcus hydrophili]|nr:DegV family protein [Vagococcus hydrophili]
MKEKIALLVDSAMDTPPELIALGGIFVAPLNINYRDRSYMDKIEITSKEVYDRIDIELPKTSLPSLSYIQRLILEIKEQGYDKILCMSISSNLSGTHNALRLALEDHPEIESFIVDTKSIGGGAGIQAAYMKVEIDKGLSFSELKEIAVTLPEKGKVFFSMATLEYLKKGGRIGLVTSIIGSALHLNPIISCNEDGIYHTVGKARGRKKGLSKLMDCIEKSIGDAEEYDLAISYGTDLEEATQLMERMKESFSKYRYFYIDEVSPVLGVYSGPDFIGVSVLPI